MIHYTLFNGIFAAVALPTSYYLCGRAERKRMFLASSRVTLLVTLLGYPWDFFAIRHGVWAFPVAPGFEIHGVPLNDLAFLALCTQVTCSALIAFDRRQRRCQRQAKSKYTSEKDTGHDRTRSF